MSRKFLTNIDLQKNEIQNVVIHKLATPPSNVPDAFIYYNTADELLYIRKNNAWKNFTGSVDGIIKGSNAIIITDNNDGTFTIDVEEATTALKGLMSASDKTKLDNATDTNTAGTIVKRDANGDFSAHDVTVNSLEITSDESTWSNNSAVTKGYVSNLLIGGVSIIGTIDCSTNPNYPTAKKGDSWYVSVAGKIGGASGESVNEGDMITCVTNSVGGDEASVGDEFIVMEHNLDLATTINAGVIKIATLADIDAGTATDKAVTPEGLNHKFNSVANYGTYNATIGNGTDTTFTVNHPLQSSDIILQLRDVATKEIVETDMTITDDNNVTMSFNVAPASNSYRLVIKR